MLQSVPIPFAMSSTQQAAIAIVGMVVGFLTLVSLAGILVPAWASVCKLRLETSLKTQMIERGMSADEILSVLNGGVPSIHGDDLPCASEVVVESEGEWTPALVLKRSEDRYFVHYVGYDMSDNEWVPASRIRFPESARYGEKTPWDGMFPAGVFGEKPWCSRAAKPAPVDREL
ncbi:MAG: Tudor-knot domain-containing protein [Isosphaeraceae bacterium]